MKHLFGIVSFAILLSMLACDDERSPEERYCDAICGWMSECVQTNQYVDVDKCKDDCNRSFDKSSLGDVCQDEELQYLICGYENAVEKGCIGDPPVSLAEGVPVAGCEEQYAAYEQCLAPADAG